MNECNELSWIVAVVRENRMVAKSLYFKNIIKETFSQNLGEYRVVNDKYYPRFE